MRFWFAFVLTRPLGAVVGDLLDQPTSKGGLDLSRYTASAVLLAFMPICIVAVRRASARGQIRRPAPPHPDHMR